MKFRTALKTLRWLPQQHLLSTDHSVYYFKFPVFRLSVLVHPSISPRPGTTSPLHFNQPRKIVSRNVLEAFRGWSTHLNEHNTTSQPATRNNACWVIGDVRVISSADVLRGCHSFQRNFHLFVSQRWTLSQIPPFTRISSNKSMLLIGVEYTTFGCSRARNQE